MEKYLEIYPPILSVSDVACILGITAKTVRHLIKAGDISNIKVGRNYDHFNMHLMVGT